jgi:hypothetical protein
MRIPYVFVSEISPSVLQPQILLLGGWQDIRQNMQTAHKGLHVIQEIWQAVN